MCMRFEVSPEKLQQILRKIEQREQSRINPKRWNESLIGLDYDDGKEPSFDDNGFWIVDAELRYYKGNDASVSIPDGVMKIGEDAFRRCTSLASLTIPASVTEISYHAFFGCTSLKEIYFGGTWEQWYAVKKSRNWNEGVPAKSITCSDGVAEL